MKKIPVLTPGQILLTEFIGPTGLTVYRVAKDARESPNRLCSVVTGKRGISVDTALRPGLYFGIDAQFWLNLQTQHDLRVAPEKKLPQIRKEVRPLAA